MYTSETLSSPPTPRSSSLTGAERLFRGLIFALSTSMFASSDMSAAVLAHAEDKRYARQACVRLRCTGTIRDLSITDSYTAVILFTLDRR